MRDLQESLGQLVFWAVAVGVMLGTALIDRDSDWSTLVDVGAIGVVFVCGYRVGRRAGEESVWEELEELTWDVEDEL